MFMHGGSWVLSVLAVGYMVLGDRFWVKVVCAIWVTANVALHVWLLFTPMREFAACWLGLLAVATLACYGRRSRSITAP